LEKLIGLRFKHYTSEHIRVFNNGLEFKTHAGGCAWCLVVCGVGFNSGIHEWKIKLIDLACDKGYKKIGVITNIPNDLTGKPIYHAECGTNYEFNGGNMSWRIGDVLRVRLDCHSWTIEFFKNEQQFGDTRDITHGLTYYPAVTTCGCNKNHFKLLNNGFHFV
jgi:hypothetical protein